jgi:lysophospholipid acyltransferase
VRALDKYRHLCIFVFAMLYLCIAHVYRMYVDYMGWAVDYSSPQVSDLGS